MKVEYVTRGSKILTYTYSIERKSERRVRYPYYIKVRKLGPRKLGLMESTVCMTPRKVRD